jgi:hypothetical protein
MAGGTRVGARGAASHWIMGASAWSDNGLWFDQSVWVDSDAPADLTAAAIANGEDGASARAKINAALLALGAETFENGADGLSIRTLLNDTFAAATGQTIANGDGGRVVRDKINAGFAALEAWTPAHLAVAPFAWYDTQTAASITQSGGTVSQWADLSGNARHLVQAVGAARPAYSATGLNGFPTLTFDGSDDYLLATGFAFTGTALGQFVVGGYTTGASDFCRLVSASDGINSDHQSLASWSSVIYATGAEFQVYVNSGLAGTSLSLAADTAALLESVATGTTWQNWKNGTSTASTAVVPAFNSTTYAIGANALSASGPYLKGFVSAVLLLGYTPTTAERQQIEGSYAWNWGLEASLPNGHPYELIAPMAFIA